MLTALPRRLPASCWEFFASASPHAVSCFMKDGARRLNWAQVGRSRILPSARRRCFGPRQGAMSSSFVPVSMIFVLRLGKSNHHGSFDPIVIAGKHF